MTQRERCNLCGSLVRVVGDPREGTMHDEHMTQTEAALRSENAFLRHAITEIHWLARRYADGRSTFAPRMLNDVTRELLRRGIPFHVTDGMPWARDGMGLLYGGLSAEEFALGNAVGDWALAPEDERCGEEALLW